MGVLDDLEAALADLRDCDETQGGVLRLLRLLTAEVVALRADVDLLGNMTVRTDGTDR